MTQGETRGLRIGSLERVSALVLIGFVMSGALLACSREPVASADPGSAREVHAPTPLPPIGAPPAAVRVEDAVVTMAAVGDVLPHKMVKASARHRVMRGADGRSTNHAGYDEVFRGLRGALDAYDVATYNQESPVTAEPYLPHMRLRFRALPEMPMALAWAGFDVAVCANNHALDQGQQGMLESMRRLRDAGLEHVGCGPSFDDASKPLIIERNGVRIALLAFARILNAYNPAIRAHREWPQILFWYDFDDAGREVLDAVRAARARDDVDAVVVNAHWDREYQPNPLGRTRDLARQVIDAGADLVVGHHPHVLQPAEWVRAADGRRAAVIYSLGNFTSEMCPGRDPMDVCDRRLGAIAVARFRKPPSGRAVLDDLRFEPTWMDHRDGCPGEAHAPTVCVRPVVVEREIAAVQEEIARAGATVPESLTRRLEGFRRRHRIISAFMGPHEEGQSPPSPYDSRLLAAR